VSKGAEVADASADEAPGTFGNAIAPLQTRLLCSMLTPPDRCHGKPFRRRAAVAVCGGVATVLRSVFTCGEMHACDRSISSPAVPPSRPTPDL
jgi:hypothetical protein